MTDGSAAVSAGSTAGGILAIDGFVFTGFELPSVFRVGGKINTEEHKFLGGTTALFVTGSEPKPFSWSGLFIGPEAVARARSLMQMRANPIIRTMSCLGIVSKCIITDVDCDIEWQYRIKYRIEVKSWCSTPFIARSDPAPTQSLAADASAVAGLAAAVGSNPLSAALSTVQSAVSAVTGTVAPVLAAAGAVGLPVTALQTALGQANSVASGALAAANGQILTGASALTAGIAGPAGSAALTQLSAGLRAASQVAAVQGVIGRMTTNAGLIL